MWPAAVLSVALAGTAACSSINPFSIQKAYGDTLAARTARASINVSFVGVGTASGRRFNFSGQGVMDLNGAAADITLQMPLGIGALRMEMLSSTIYLQLPAVLTSKPGALPPGKTWVSLDLLKAFGPNAGSLFQQANQDNPAALLQQLRGASVKGVRNLGTETIAGVTTTHYHATVNPAQRLRQIADAPGATPLAKAAAAQAARTGPTPMDFWVDSADRLRQFKMTVKVPNQGSLVETIDLSDFGVPVTVTPPPADQTVDATTLPGFSQPASQAPPGPSGT